MDQLLKVFDADLRMSVARRRLILVGAGLHSGSEARVLKVAEKVKSLVRIPVDQNSQQPKFPTLG
jgi:hypothetical protein